jgi:hypothetical protein
VESIRNTGDYLRLPPMFAAKQVFLLARWGWRRYFRRTHLDGGEANSLVGVTLRILGFVSTALQARTLTEIPAPPRRSTFRGGHSRRNMNDDPLQLDLFARRHEVGRRRARIHDPHAPTLVIVGQSE